tara:strand:- start:1834 stop:2481 length:648 start_codon:yes stop_codon:yes gene_type:complete
MATVTAIGDVHGCSSELVDLICEGNATADEIIFLGDLFDRTPYVEGDEAVLEIIQMAQEQPDLMDTSKVTVLRGNHEDMLIRAIEAGPGSDWYELWESNGGDAAFYELACDHLDWLKSLPLYAIRGNYLFVHAGVRPGIPLEQQKESDLLWIREQFIDEPDHGLPYVIVHGHTIVNEIDITDNRINLDTGCFHTGNLSFMRFDYAKPNDQRTQLD